MSMNRPTAATAMRPSAPTASAPQVVLSPEQVRAFYHDEFVEDQVRHFAELFRSGVAGDRVVLDVGGGCGFFARRLRAAIGIPVRVLDSDATSIEECRKAGVDAVLGDALRAKPTGDEQVVCFNLVLHHLVAGSETATRQLQVAALRAWRELGVPVFVNEYIYESRLLGLAPRLIYEITSSRLLSRLAAGIARYVPALRANTFGVGVRFRSHDDWRQVFDEAGYDVVGHVNGAAERIRLPLHLMSIRAIRRDSFRLAPTPLRTSQT
jgi:hypothetical protein